MNVLRLAPFALCATLSRHDCTPLRRFKSAKKTARLPSPLRDKVIVLADTATVHIGFIAYGPDSDYRLRRRLPRLERHRQGPDRRPVFASDAIESENQNVSPVQEYQIDKLTPAEKAQRKFQVTQSWTVRTNADDAAKVLDLAVKAGANQSGQIDWSLKDENAAQSEAAAKALQRARTVAAEMAKGLNAKLGALLYASNETQAEPPRPLHARHGRCSLWRMDKVAPLAINPRQIEKTATVYAVFAIE